MAHADHAVPATRPALEVADILRQRRDAYAESHRLSAQQHRVIDALVNCRTAALGGFKAQCDHCGAVTIQYASCRNRHCPKCQTLSQVRWVERQCADLLDIGYWHVVFTLPHELNPVAQGNPALVYRLLFKAASRTLLEFGDNPRWLGGELGITMVLHTWGQNLGQHIHVHCIVTDGGLSPHGQRWLSPVCNGFLFPTAALSKVFRGKYLDFLGTAHRNGELRLKPAGGGEFEALETTLRSHKWVVYSKAPFAGAGQVLAYLGR
ncbi:MAG: transposase zinc-binding domain-containing protein [Alphaproteobacteria bacterium]|nr:transposase zinc-binding domain-containing protein [Alphaproteobacteria bacterium]